MRGFSISFIGAALLLMLGCAGEKLPDDRLEARAQRFVTLVLQLGMHDQKEVDTYFGPAHIDPRGRGEPPSLAAMHQSAVQLLSEADTAQTPTEQAERAAALKEQIQHFTQLLEMLSAPSSMTFDEEAQRIYGIEVGSHDESALAPQWLQQLDELLPGPEPLAFRVAKYRNQFVVPVGKREEMFTRALQECRERTALHWSLPEDEQLEVQFTRDVSAAWHKYEGKHRSTLKVNPLAIAYLGQMIDLACHEGYPGHHAQYLVMEMDAGAAGLPLEHTVALMRSPANVLREGAANYGVELAFPLEQRVAFERDVLFPMAGFAPAEAQRHAEVHRLITELALSAMPILRDYRDGVISFNAATFHLERQALIASPTALLKFVDDLGAYSSGYTVARNAVRNHVESTSGERGTPWAVLRTIVAEPQTIVLRETPAAWAGDK